MKRKLFCLLCLFAATDAMAQMKIDNSIFFIQAGATVTVQGDVTSNADIQGIGLLLLKGSTLQSIDFSGKTIPNLELDNAANVTLQNSNVRISNNLVLTNGKFQTANFDLILAATANITGANNSRFVATNGNGFLKKELTADIAAYELPVGENANYRPAYLTTAGSSYASANFGVRVSGTKDVNTPPMAASFIKTSWPLSKTGITGGAVTLAGQYIDPVDIAGTENNIAGYFFNGTDWSSAGEIHNAAINRVTVPVTTNTGTLSGINKFLLVGAKVFLQGAYDSVSGLMADNLRTLPFGPSSNTANFPSSDPYRVAPYNASFTHVANAGVETITDNAVVAAQTVAANNIVDWVFLELRDLTASPGNTILQTRSALVQRDGDIVDIDGVSPVTFNNLADGNYILAVRHRNHLGLSIDQSSPRTITEKKSTAFSVNAIDLRTANDAQLFGTAAAYATAPHPVLGTVNLLWGGNANLNNQTRFTSLNNDRDLLLINALGNVPSNFINNVYHAADVNMNRVVRFSGLNNDRDFILINVLGNVPSIFKTQALPN